MSISVVIPGIRTHFWPRVVNSLASSIPYHAWEVIFIGPFEPPQSLKDEPQVKFIQSYAKVPVCIQLGILAAENELVFQTVDDGIFFTNAISECVEIFQYHGTYNDMMNMRYSEGVNFQDNVRPNNFFEVKNCPEYHQPYINRSYSISVQPLMYKQRLIELGGLDCQFEYSNHSHIDLAIRLQNDGGKILHSPCGAGAFEHYPNRTADHGPIHDSQTLIDQPLFEKMWSNPRNSHIDITNYLEYNVPWIRRFNRRYDSYAEMAKEEGYQF